MEGRLERTGKQRRERSVRCFFTWNHIGTRPRGDSQNAVLLTCLMFLQGREEQKKQRQLDLERLLQRYQNVKSELESQQNIERIRSEKFMSYHLTSGTKSSPNGTFLCVSDSFTFGRSFELRKPMRYCICVCCCSMEKLRALWKNSCFS